MIRSAILTSLLLTAGTVKGDLKLNFESVTNPKEITAAKRLAGNVTISNPQDNAFLSLGAPKALIQLKTNTESKALKLSIDWQRQKNSNGSVLNLTDYNHNKKVLSIMASRKGEIKASSFVARKMKQRNLFISEAGMWYRFNIDLEGNRYTLKVTERGEDNTKENGAVVYDSVERKRRLRINPKITPHLVVLQQFSKSKTAVLHYDNLMLEE